MPPRLTDWSLAAATAVGLATGIYSLVAGRADQAWVFALHAMAGLWLGLLLWGKLRRVAPRLLRLSGWDRATLFGALSLLLTLLVLVSGIAWSWGGRLFLLGFNLLNWHILAALLLMLLLSAHMIARARPLRGQDVQGRRPFLRWAALTVGAALIWPFQQLAQSALDLPAARRRFTGSRESGSFQGNLFPTTSWVADAPRPLDPNTWSLEVGGAAQRQLRFSLGDLAGGSALQPHEITATLDCTGGFYSAQHWRGVSLESLLAAVEPLPEAGWVRVTSVTGYRWAFSLADARQMLLATHVGGEPLSYGHGAPLRLVAPSKRGFAWVKWVVAIELLNTPDWGTLASLYTSSFTPKGRGIE